jgi:hypothetical protein
MMRIPSQSDQRGDAAVIAGFNVALTEVTVVGQQTIGFSEVGGQFIQFIQHSDIGWQ